MVRKMKIKCNDDTVRTFWFNNSGIECAHCGKRFESGSTNDDRRAHCCKEAVIPDPGFYWAVENDMINGITIIDVSKDGIFLFGYEKESSMLNLKIIEEVKPLENKKRCIECLKKVGK